MKTRNQLGVALLKMCVVAGTLLRVKIRLRYRGEIKITLALYQWLQPDHLSFSITPII